MNPGRSQLQEESTIKALAFDESKPDGLLPDDDEKRRYLSAKQSPAKESVRDSELTSQRNPPQLETNGEFDDLGSIDDSETGGGTNLGRLAEENMWISNRKLEHVNASEKKVMGGNSHRLGPSADSVEEEDGFN
jgi:hypothetical protein